MICSLHVEDQRYKTEPVTKRTSNAINCMHDQNVLTNCGKQASLCCGKLFRCMPSNVTRHLIALMRYYVIKVKHVGTKCTVLRRPYWDVGPVRNPSWLCSIQGMNPVQQRVFVQIPNPSCRVLTNRCRYWTRRNCNKQMTCSKSLRPRRRPVKCELAWLVI